VQDTGGAAGVRRDTALVDRTTLDAQTRYFWARERHIGVLDVAGSGPCDVRNLAATRRAAEG
jgi:hypothetical protein